MNTKLVDGPAQAALYGGAATSLTLWGLQLSDVGVIVSMLVALLGLAVHVWAIWRREIRAQELHQLTVEALRGAAAKGEICQK